MTPGTFLAAVPLHAAVVTLPSAACAEATARKADPT
jgi:hypothetical protein